MNVVVESWNIMCKVRKNEKLMMQPWPFLKLPLKSLVLYSIKTHMSRVLGTPRLTRTYGMLFPGNLPSKHIICSSCSLF